MWKKFQKFSPWWLQNISIWNDKNPFFGLVKTQVAALHKVTLIWKNVQNGGYFLDRVASIWAYEYEPENLWACEWEFFCEDKTGWGPTTVDLEGLDFMIYGVILMKFDELANAFGWYYWIEKNVIIFNRNIVLKIPNKNNKSPRYSHKTHKSNHNKNPHIIVWLKRYVNLKSLSGNGIRRRWWWLWSLSTLKCTTIYIIQNIQSVCIVIVLWFRAIKLRKHRCHLRDIHGKMKRLL